MIEKIISAVRLQRTGIKTKMLDRVQATALYNGGIVNFYHAFDQQATKTAKNINMQA